VKKQPPLGENSPSSCEKTTTFARSAVKKQPPLPLAVKKQPPLIDLDKSDNQPYKKCSCEKTTTIILKNIKT
jgi:hypothetical protein